MTPPRLRTRLLVGPALRAQPDGRLITLAREGHEPALEEVVRRYRPALVRYAATVVPADRADDVVQEAITRALPGIRDGDSELHLRAWLYTIVRNTALNNLRDSGPAMDHLDENFDGVEQPPQALERREELAAVVAGVQALPQTQREALVKREMEGMSHSEIGAALGISGGAARQLIHRGRMTLRESLGALIPLPLLRQLLEGVSGPAVAGTGAGGAIAAKAIVAVLAAGGALTAGVALQHQSHDSAKADPVVATGPARLPGGGGPGSALGGPSNGGGSDPASGQRDGQSSGRGPGAGDNASLAALGASRAGAGATTGSGEHHGGNGSGDGSGGNSGQGEDSHHGGGFGGGEGETPGGGGTPGGGEGSGGHSGSGEPSGGSGDGGGGSSEHSSGSGSGEEPSGSGSEGSGTESPSEGGLSGSSPDTSPDTREQPSPPGD